MARRATVRVRGLRDLSRAFKVADKSFRDRWREARREIGLPVAHTAEQLALAEISGLRRDQTWGRMRVGVTQTVVYVAPKSRNRGGSRRKNMGDLLMNRAMAPALERHAVSTERKVGELLDRMSRDWEKA